MRKNYILVFISLISLLTIYFIFEQEQTFLFKPDIFLKSIKCDEYFNNSLHGEFDWPSYPIVPAVCKNRILVVTQARSGSTFLGDLLQQSWHTFYIYEPIYFLRQTIHVDQIKDKGKVKGLVNILVKLFNCKSLDENEAINNKSVSWINEKKKSMEKLLGENNKFVQEQEICHKCPNIIIKSIRIGFTFVIHLIKSLKMENSKNNLVIIRYEDLALNTKLVAKKLYQRLGLIYNQKIEDWILLNSQIKETNDSRNTSENTVHWVKNFEAFGMDLNSVQNHCSDVMQMLGYNQIIFPELNQQEIGFNPEINIKSEELVIDIRNALFRYKTGPAVLEDLCLEVPRGKIFALLGPNGTGKTTLTRAILGRLQLKSGSIKVLGTHPGTKYSDIPGSGVGYMPQELALFENFQIKQILRYYGMIFHLEGEELIQRIEYLMELLGLPEKDRPIDSLSGGQKRLVSLALTMLHSPRLIILDEPTVGVDSLLRNKIWKHLEECCVRNGQTVLITTHYIEEARSAANVAFMSYGTILKQSDPQTLLQEYKCQTLEGVFLHLCQRRDERRKSVEISDILQEPKETSSLRSISNDSPEILQKLNQTNNERLVNDGPQMDAKRKHQAHPKNLDFKRVKALIMIFHILALRRLIFMLTFFIFPFLVISMLKYALANDPAHIPMVIFNEDQNPKYSQIIIDGIDRYHIDLRFAGSNETAFESVVNGTSYMSVVFGENFSDNFEYRLKNILEITDEELDSSQIKVYADFSNHVMSIFGIKYLLGAFNKFLRQQSREFGLNAERFFHPITVEKPIYGEFNLNIAEFFSPGVLLATCHLFPLAISSLQILVLRQNSSLERILVSGVRPIELFVAHFILNLFLIAIQELLILFISFVVYENTQNGSYFLVYFLLISIGIQGMAFGLTVGLYSKNVNDGLVGLFAFMVPLWFVSGAFWPIEATPLIYRNIAIFGPLCQPLNSFRAIMIKGLPLSDPVVYIGFIVLFVYICVISLFNIISIKTITK